MGCAPELVRTRKRCGLGLWVSQSDARYSCGHRRHKLCIAHFRAKHEKLAHAVAPPLPKKSNDLSGTPEDLCRSP